MNEPFPIQAATLPNSLAGRDVLGRGCTGSGQTLAFGLALLVRTSGQRAQSRRPFALVLVPTRELAQQVTDALTPYAQALKLRLATVVGGMSIGRRAQALRNGAEVVVATPGRLRDLIERGECRLDQVGITVLEDLIRDNPARGLRLPSPRHVHPVVWTPRRVVAWRRTGERPAVAVWTVEQLNAFLAFVRDDRLLALWWLIALRGLRRAEVAGLRWIDFDTDRRELTTTCQLVHTDHGLFPCPPKSASSQRGIALDLDTLRLLYRYERAQRGEMGTGWSPSTPMFTREHGEAIDPDYLSYRFHKLVLASGLPPARLHDLRHGAATLPLAAGTDLRVVQGMLGHASIVLTADTYTSVLPQLYHDSARATARLVLKAARKTARKVDNARPGV